MGVHNAEVYSQIKDLLEIPQDEPIFIFRAQDNFAPRVLRHYKAEVGTAKLRSDPDNETWFSDLDNDISNFRNWQETNRDKVKVPD